MMSRFFITFITFTTLSLSETISFINAPLLMTIPETTKWYSDSEIYMSSFGYGSIYKLSKDASNNYTSTLFFSHPNLTASTGFILDSTTNKMYICIHSNPSDVLNAYTGGSGISIQNYTKQNGPQLSGLMTVNLLDKSVESIVNFYDYDPNNFHFANDVIIHSNGNAFVTDSFSGRVYEIKNGVIIKAIYDSNWFQPNLITLNGIARPAGSSIILVNTLYNSKIWKIDVTNNYMTSEVKYNNIDDNGILSGFDGMTIDSLGTIYAANNAIDLVYQFFTQDDYISITLNKVIKTRYDVPTSVSVLDNQVIWVSSAYFDRTGAVTLYPTEILNFAEQVEIINDGSCAGNGKYFVPFIVMIILFSVAVIVVCACAIQLNSARGENKKFAVSNEFERM